MKKVAFIIIVLAVVAGLYFLLKPEKDIMSDPRIPKFAMIQAEIEIEAERLDQDSTFMEGMRDSIYESFGVTEGWINEVEDLINEQPENWVDVYQLMIKHAEKVRDSLLHKRPIQNDST
ncbi:MAG: hypothetical protein GF310_05855 [candidate division Zixibacteria bacterium]|nr:hypothetical protein [candidate division Zixibacteria bacterium]